MNPVKALENHGQAVWLDFLARGFVAKGELKKLIDTDGLKGVTSNPSIFEKAIGSSDEYDGAIGQALKRGDRPVADLFEHLAVEDIQHAADVLRPVYDHLKGEDGFVSLEVSPYLAMDTRSSIAEAERLWKDVKRKNLMVKVPATPERLPWASTGTKNKDYSDVLYDEELIGPNTVNTMPPATLDAFRDHGKLRDSLEENIEDARGVLEELERSGISLDAITAELVKEGVQLFADATDKLYGAVAYKRAALLGAAIDRQQLSLGTELAKTVDKNSEDWRASAKI